MPVFWSGCTSLSLSGFEHGGDGYFSFGDEALSEPCSWRRADEAFSGG